MACFHPLTAYKVPGGVSFSDADFDGVELKLPCGRCAGCRLQRSYEWAMRCMHEVQSHPFNCSVTLTYDDEHLSSWSLVRRDFTLFAKRLRKRLRLPISYFGCGEYGEKNSRPHFHAMLFGVEFPDKIDAGKSRKGYPLYESPLLTKIWGNGRAIVSDASFEMAAYIARYNMKKVNGKLAPDHYRRVDLETGEVTQLVPEFNMISCRPAIGKRWLMRYGDTDVFPHDRVVAGGMELKPPRYYDKMLKELNPDRYKEVKFDREDRALPHAKDNTPRRLEDREKVVLGRFNISKRDFEK